MRWGREPVRDSWQGNGPAETEEREWLLVLRRCGCRNGVGVSASSETPHFGEGLKGVGVADDDVVEERDVEQDAGGVQVARHSDVVGGGRRVAARVIVHEDYGDRASRDCCAKHFPRMDRRLVDEPTRDHDRVTQESVLGVEGQEPKDLTRLERCQRSHEVEHVARAAHVGRRIRDRHRRLTH